MTFNKISPVISKGSDIWIVMVFSLVYLNELACMIADSSILSVYIIFFVLISIISIMETALFSFVNSGSSWI